MPSCSHAQCAMYKYSVHDILRYMQDNLFASRFVQDYSSFSRMETSADAIVSVFKARV